jgi:hypothetical protein
LSVVFALIITIVIVLSEIGRVSGGGAESDRRRDTVEGCECFSSW